MFFHSRVLQLIASLCASCAILPTASAHGIDTVQAHTAEDIVNAILSANTSGKTTVIHVEPGEYAFAESFDADGGPSLLPPITGTVLLLGKRADTTRFINSGQLARFINVRENGILQVRGISFSGGVKWVDCQSSPDSPQPCPHGGGAALNAGGLLWFEDSVLSGNTTFEYDREALGGAILSTGGHLHVANTTISGNRAQRVGGGIAVLGGTATLVNSIVTGNTLSAGYAPKGAALIGFGLYIQNAEVSIDHSTVSRNTNNSAQDAFAGILHGFGIYNDGGTVSITNSAVVGNGEAGGTPTEPGAGGGVYNGGTMLIADSTVAGNAAGTLGGGIANFGKLTLQSVTVARNQVAGIARNDVNRIPYPPTCHSDTPFDPGHLLCYAGGGGIWNANGLATTTMLSTAVALNTQNQVPLAGTYGPDCFGGFYSNDYNAIGVLEQRYCYLIVPGSGSTDPAANDQVPVDAQLGDLTDDGEPGNAHVPLLSGSPLIDAGGKVLSDCTLRDQLGERRTDGDHDGRVECDVGAVEFQRAKKH